jgi:hypothetical protein
MATLAPVLEGAAGTINSARSVDSLSGPSTGGGLLGGAPAGMPASGSALDVPTPGGGDSEVALATAMAQQAVQFQNLSSLGGNVASKISNMLGHGFAMGGAAAGTGLDGPDKFLEILLKMLGLGDLIDVLSLRTSRGTETLFQKPGLGGVVAADMGLPLERFGLWEMRDANIGTYQMGDRDKSNIFVGTEEMQNAALKDLGPSFVVALQKGVDKLSLRKEGSFNLGRAPLRDYEADMAQNKLKAIGKARLYYRAPVERWTTRSQLVSHANLMLPYWNARLEGLNYPEKALFFSIN